MAIRHLDDPLYVLSEAEVARQFAYFKCYLNLFIYINMASSLGGATFIFNGNRFDYCFRECILNLQELCDQVCVVVIKSDDGTEEAVREILDSKTKLIVLDDTIWNLLSGKERLSHFSNIAIANLDTDYVWYQQADEVTSELSFDYIRASLNLAREAFLISRLNLWNDAYHYLPPETVHNQPCSTQVIRLAKSKYRCIGDAESIDAQAIPMLGIYIFHLGFVRDRKIMKSKVIHMQEQVFETPHDSRLDVADEFRPLDYFKREDLAPIPIPLPKHVEEWAKKRLV